MKKIIHKLRTEKQRFIYRVWYYFRRGYANYVAFAVGLMNFLTIQYYLLVQRVPLLKVWFSNILLFAIVAVPLLFVTAALIGYLDINKGVMREEFTVQARQHPYWRKVMEKLETMERELKEIKQKLQ